MTSDVAGLIAGAAVGSVSIVISEALLALWRSRPDWSPLAVALTGATLRTLWILVALAAGLTSARLAAKPFAAVLFAAYLAAQVFEGLRFQRYAETR